jgi:hypothetical protein
MRRPEDLLAKCYVDTPDDIDLEVIAFEEGLVVRDEPLAGCEASLVGYGNRGIITVAPGVSLERRRFSIAHEIGHWEQHRGKSFSCRIEERALDKAARTKEREADDYASSLMMPTNLYKEGIASRKGEISLAMISELGAIFRASFPAAAIRYVELSGEPVVLIFNGVAGRKWSARSKRVPEHLWIKSVLEPDSFAHDLQSLPICTKRRGKMPAEVWFDGVVEDRYDVIEHSVRLQEGVYTLLHLADETLLEERLSAKRMWKSRDD